MKCATSPRVTSILFVKSCCTSVDCAFLCYTSGCISKVFHYWDFGGIREISEFLVQKCENHFQKTFMALNFFSWWAQKSWTGWAQIHNTQQEQQWEILCQSINLQAPQARKVDGSLDNTNSSQFKCWPLVVNSIKCKYYLKQELIGYALCHSRTWVWSFVQRKWSWPLHPGLEDF